MVLCKFQKEYTRFIIPFFLAVLTLLSLPPYHNRLRPELWPLIALFCIWLWGKLLVSPFKVEVDDNGGIIFHCFLRKLSVRSEDITSYYNGDQFLVLQCGKKKIWVSTLMDNVSLLKNYIQKYNQQVTEDLLPYKKKPYWLIMALLLYFIIAIWWFEYR